MSALLWFALWAALIFVMMRFGCGAHVMGHGQGRKRTDAGPESGAGLRWVPPTQDIDPVCGKSVETAAAKPSVFDGHVYYFCSRECREVFEAAPDRYSGRGADALIRRLKDSHA